MENEFHVTWFDGGGTTGWGHVCINRQAFSRPEHHWEDYVIWWDCGEFLGPSTVIYTEALRWTDSILSEASFLSYHIGGEDFDLVQTVGRDDDLLSPVRFNAVMDWECTKRGLTYRYQNRALRLSVTASRLKLFGFDGRWTKTGKGKDQFAAMQHLIVYIRRLKRESISHPWKLNESGIHGAYWDCRCKQGRKCDLAHPK
jgi:hypothetical protein